MLCYWFCCCQDKKLAKQISFWWYFLHTQNIFSFFVKNIGICWIFKLCPNNLGTMNLNESFSWESWEKILNRLCKSPNDADGHTLKLVLEKTETSSPVDCVRYGRQEFNKHVYTNVYKPMFYFHEEVFNFYKGKINHIVFCSVLKHFVFLSMFIVQWLWLITHCVFRFLLF